MSSRSGTTHKSYPRVHRRDCDVWEFRDVPKLRSSALAEVKAQLREACVPACPEEQQPRASRDSHIL